MTHLFDHDPGPVGPWQSARCAGPNCTHISWSGPWCELCRPRHGRILPPPVARFVGPTNVARQSEERGPR